MGRAERTAELERIKAESVKEIQAIKENGGTVQFVFEYHKYLNDLRTADENQPAVAGAGKRFRRRPVQLSAVAAMKDMAHIEASKDANIPAFDPELSERLKTAARAAYVSAAGHFEKEPLNSVPEPGPESQVRRQKAAADWDRLIKSDPNSLVSLVLFGHESSKAQPMSKLEIAKGVGSLIFLVALAVGAYYIWSSQ